MKFAKVALTVLILFSFLIPPQSVHADIAPPPAPQLGGLEPFQYQKTNVQMIYERVEMDVQPITQQDAEYTHSGSRVSVTAYFVMRNLGSAPETMQAIFPVESFSHCRMGYGGGNSYTNYFVREDSFIVTVGSNNVPVQKIETDHPFKIEGVCDKMSWAGFDVTFPVGEDVVAKVQYVMETELRADLMQNIEYILETGAGWAGPIQRGYVIVKFPYAATAENVLSSSTPGYQFLYNEVFWSFENLEPTSENNIQVSIVSPDIWQEILSIRRDLKENPKLPAKWLDLADIYWGIAIWHWDQLRSSEYLQRVPSIYEAGIAANPDNAELYAKYAEFKLYQWSPRSIGQISAQEAAPILSLLNKALTLDAHNETAKLNLSVLLTAAPFITFTPPPTIPPTVTSLVTATPSATPTATMTFSPEGPVEPVGTTVQAEPVIFITSTPEPTATNVPTQIAQAGDRNRSSAPLIFLGILFVFAVGMGAGVLWQKRTGK